MSVNSPTKFESPVSVETVTAADEFIINLARNPEMLEKVLCNIPTDINEFLSSADFEQSCKVKFNELLDENSGGTMIEDTGEFGLLLENMGPVLQNLAEGNPTCIRASQDAGQAGVPLTAHMSDRFLEIFDVDHNGVFDFDEFLQINRFFFTIAQLESLEHEGSIPNPESPEHEGSIPNPESPEHEGSIPNPEPPEHEGSIPNVTDQTSGENREEQAAASKLQALQRGKRDRAFAAHKKHCEEKMGKNNPVKASSSPNGKQKGVESQSAGDKSKKVSQVGELPFRETTGDEAAEKLRLERMLAVNRKKIGLLLHSKKMTPEKVWSSLICSGKASKTPVPGDPDAKLILTSDIDHVKRLILAMGKGHSSIDPVVLDLVGDQIDLVTGETGRISKVQLAQCWSLLNSEGTPEVQVLVEQARERKAAELARLEAEEEAQRKLQEVQGEKTKAGKRLSMSAKPALSPPPSPNKGRRNSKSFFAKSNSTVESDLIREEDIPKIADHAKWDELLSLLKPHSLTDDEASLRVLRFLRLTDKAAVVNAEEMELRKFGMSRIKAKKIQSVCLSALELEKSLRPPPTKDKLRRSSFKAKGGVNDDTNPSREKEEGGVSKELKTDEGVNGSASPTPILLDDHSAVEVSPVITRFEDTLETKSSGDSEQNAKKCDNDDEVCPIQFRDVKEDKKGSPRDKKKTGPGTMRSASTPRVSAPSRRSSGYGQARGVNKKSSGNGRAELGKKQVDAEEREDRVSMSVDRAGLRSSTTLERRQRLADERSQTRTGSNKTPKNSWKKQKDITMRRSSGYTARQPRKYVSMGSPSSTKSEVTSPSDSISKSGSSEKEEEGGCDDEEHSFEEDECPLVVTDSKVLSSLNEMKFELTQGSILLSAALGADLNDQITQGPYQDSIEETEEKDEEKKEFIDEEEKEKEEEEEKEGEEEINCVRETLFQRISGHDNRSWFQIHGGNVASVIVIIITESDEGKETKSSKPTRKIFKVNLKQELQTMQILSPNSLAKLKLASTPNKDRLTYAQATTYQTSTSSKQPSQHSPQKNKSQLQRRREQQQRRGAATKVVDLTYVAGDKKVVPPPPPPPPRDITPPVRMARSQVTLVQPSKISFQGGIRNPVTPIPPPPKRPVQSFGLDTWHFRSNPTDPDLEVSSVSDRSDSSAEVPADSELASQLNREAKRVSAVLELTKSRSAETIQGEKKYCRIEAVRFALVMDTLLVVDTQFGLFSRRHWRKGSLPIRRQIIDNDGVSDILIDSSLLDFKQTKHEANSEQSSIIKLNRDGVVEDGSVLRVVLTLENKETITLQSQFLLDQSNVSNNELWLQLGLTQNGVAAQIRLCCVDPMRPNAGTGECLGDLFYISDIFIATPQRNET